MNKKSIILVCLFLSGCGFGKIADSVREAQTEVVCLSGLAKLQYTREEICTRCHKAFGGIEYNEYCEEKSDVN